LQQNYLSEKNISSKVGILNSLAANYIDNNNKYLAYICYCESLNLDSSQYQLINNIEKLETEVSIKHNIIMLPVTCMVSVIIPTYNRPIELKQCIASVLNQCFNNYEIIVINDCGDDSAKEVVDSFDSNKIIYIKLENNKGVAGARNEGIKQAKGKYIAYLDDDDIFYENHLDVAVSYLESNTEIDVVYTNAWWVYGVLEGNTFVPNYSKTCDARPNFYNKNMLAERNYISTLNLVHKKSCFIQTGLFNEELRKSLEDYDMLLRFAKIFKFHQIDIMTGEYRWKHNNWSVEGNKVIDFWAIIIRSYYTTFGGYAALSKSYYDVNNITKAKYYINLIEQNYDTGFKYINFYTVYFDHIYCIATDRLIKKAIIDYFQVSPRSCLNKALATSSILMLRLILPCLPKRYLKSLKERFQKNQLITKQAGSNG